MPIAEIIVLVISGIIWIYKHNQEAQTPEERDADVDKTMAGDNLSIGERLHRLADRVRRRKNSPSK